MRAGPICCIGALLASGCTQDATSPVRAPSHATPSFILAFNPLTPAAWTAQMTALNEAGTMVGYFGTESSKQVAWRTGSSSGLISDDAEQYAFGVSEDGVIVGYSETGDVRQGRYWRIGGGGGVLPPLPGHEFSVGYDAGPGMYPIIVGYSFPSFGTPRPARWDLSELGARVTALPAPDDIGYALAINVTAGLIVGRAGSRPARWSIATNELTMESFNGSAWDVNSHGVIVGDTWQGHAFMLIPGGPPHILGTGRTLASLQGVNDDNLAVGFLWDRLKPIRAIAWRPEMGQRPYIIGPRGSEARRINNANQVVGYAGTGSANEGGTWTIDTSFDDDGDGVIFWEDNCPYRANRDQANGDGDADGDICDPDSPPVITRHDADRTTLLEGDAVRFRAGGFDPGRRDLLWTWNFTDGTSLEGASVRKVFGDDGDYEATVTADNQETPVTTSSSLAITVRNTAPQVAISPLTANAGVSATLRFVISDAGADDAPFSYAINWRDGTTSNGVCVTSSGCTIEVAHTWNAARTYRVLVTVTDKDAGSRTRSLDVVVSL